ncbi:hypothetical protein A5736_20370 [Mycobacterium sp. SP-6446]|nr:hypothetical protein A5736_20370 [Mycobacterium sp. SP-6446]
MGVVERTGHGGDDPQDLINRYSRRIAVSEKPERIEAIDIIHRDPQLAVELTPVMDADDVRMPEL